MQRLLLIPILFLLACQPDTRENHQVAGVWQGIAWQVNGENSNREARDVRFTFTLPDEYGAIYDQQGEVGTFRIEGDKLYTIAPGQQQKMVRFRIPHPDTLILDMNRAGTAETLILGRIHNEE